MPLHRLTPGRPKYSFQKSRDALSGCLPDVADRADIAGSPSDRHSRSRVLFNERSAQGLGPISYLWRRLGEAGRLGSALDNQCSCDGGAGLRAAVTSGRGTAEEILSRISRSAIATLAVMSRVIWSWPAASWTAS